MDEDSALGGYSKGLEEETASRLQIYAMRNKAHSESVLVRDSV